MSDARPSDALLKEIRVMIERLKLGEEEVGKWVGERVLSVVKLPGDASTRRYYRVHAADGATYVVMRMEAFDGVGAGKGDQLPFLVVRQHLEEAGIDVPRVHDRDPALGMILLEDLGDVTLLRHLQEVASADVERHLYQRVIDSLVRLQIHASPARKPAPGFEAYGLRFDYEKLMWEVGFTLEHFYQTYLARKIPEAELVEIREDFGRICRHLAGLPTVLTHRDFHSRNVMVVPKKEERRASNRRPEGPSAGSASSPHGERLVMIDFQDARLGPPQYDLASLLKDSYYQLEESQIRGLLDYYVSRWEASGGEPLARDEFIYGFDLMAVQRNFKAIGSFASFLNRRGNAVYLKYIGNTFENIRRTLLKYPEFSRLRERLFHYYYF